MVFDLIWVVPSLANLGGTEYAAVTFAKLIVADGHRLRFVTGRGAHPDWRARLRDDGSGRLALIEAEQDSPLALCALARRLHQAAPADLIQFMPIEAHCLAWLSDAPALPVAGWEPTDLSPRCWWLSDALGALIHRLDALLVFNPDAAGHAVRRYGYRGGIHVVPNTVMPAAPRVPSVRGGAAPVVGCIARLSAEKGLEFLLAAFGLLLRRVPAARLAIWGDGGDRDRLGELATMLGIAGQVDFHGAFAPFSAIDDIAHAADVFVSSSLFEGAPVALLELAARGRPVAATATAGARWICGADYEWIVPIGDTGGLADALAALLASDASRRDAGARLAARFARRFSPEQSVGALRAAYAAMLGRVAVE
ncbi:glycosyltransferase [Burkholderia alba]|uniref:glycosyltransferase n=1 Tax=Burkholderia alba TaxID=2683677 RepID=UPI002B059C3C|nr:glycosyltransferase [Burkholderia alba]